MRLDQVIPGAPMSAGDLEIAELAYDNRRAAPGTLFFCVPERIAVLVDERCFAVTPGKSRAPREDGKNRSGGE